MLRVSDRSGILARVALDEATTAGRRRNMAAIRRRDTKPEKAVRSRLHARGLRFRVDQRLDLPSARVRPDVVFSRQKVAVFVDGCYWHGCPVHGVRLGIKNESYWGPKISGNVARDRRADAALTEAGWTVLRVWEHESVEEAVDRIVLVVANQAPTDPG